MTAKIAKPSPLKPPPGYKVRLGGYLGHGKRSVHIMLPDGFKFTWDLSEGHPFDARRDAIRMLYELDAREGLRKPLP